LSQMPIPEMALRINRRFHHASAFSGVHHRNIFSPRSQRLCGGFGQLLHTTWHPCFCFKLGRDGPAPLMAALRKCSTMQGLAPERRKVETGFSWRALPESQSRRRSVGWDHLNRSPA
jgi:hypothetical protein